MVKSFWDSESFDVSGAHIHDDTNTDPVLLRLENTICKKDDRFRSLVVRLKRNNLVTDYHEIIQQQLRSMFIEPVDSTSSPSGVGHCISHHPVIHMDRATTKVRIEYDASAQITPQHNSLNDCLHSGPNLLNDIHRMLLQFRTYKIVLLADIEKAILQVGLRMRDRNATRFFWLKDCNRPIDCDNVQEYRFCRVPFGATSSPFLLAATLRHHLNQLSDPIVKSLAPNFYVDNLTTGVSTVAEAKQLYTVAKQSLNVARMNLREWISNSEDFIASLPYEDRAKECLAKVFGVPWNTKADTLTCKPITQDNQASHVVTKRRILQVVSKVFDPLGIVSPVVITAKIFIQELWKDGLDWDNKVSVTFLIKWKAICHELTQLEEIKVPRLIPVADATGLHIFIDASQRAYGGVAYIRVKTNENVSTHLLCSKSRVSPVKKVTIPRLELIAAVMGCKLANFITQCMPNLTKSVHVWSDSQVVLHWIKGSQLKLDVFVKNRVHLLRQYNHNFAYSSTGDNPADQYTRGSTIQQLKSSQIWWKGPSWSQRSNNNWPQHPTSSTIACQDTIETPAEPTTLISTTPNLEIDQPFTIDLHRFNSLTKLLRVTAYCNRFIMHLRKGIPSTTLIITSEELDKAKKIWIKWLQETTVGNEIMHLKRSQTSSTIKELGLIISDNILRCGGRFKFADVSTNFLNPILLPKNHYFTDLVIMHYHNKIAHQGVHHTLVSIRQYFWIPSERQQVRSVLRKYRLCRLWEGPTYTTPVLPPLPPSRLSQSPPFSYTGCDFAGPITVFDNDVSTKTYICLFTCAVTRAVH